MLSKLTYLNTSFRSGMVLFTVLLLASSFKNDNNTYKQVPVIGVNFYLMGMDQVDHEITISIGENIKTLNNQFKGVIDFELNELFMDENGAYLPDIHNDFLAHNDDNIEVLLNPIEESGNINVYLFHTYCLEGTNQALTGFTPILPRGEEHYAANSPKFDRIFVAYEGLLSQTTLTHEVGHFLGLKHPWELSPIQKKYMGMNVSNTHLNNMTYNETASQFTFQQLEKMRRHALKFRSYITKRIHRVPHHRV